MASCKLGHIYVVKTVLAKTPKAKFALCVCSASGYFVWINTLASPHGKDQLQLPAGCHELIRHDSHLDLSRIVKHPDREVATAQEFPCISKALCGAILNRIEEGLVVLTAKQIAVVLENLKNLHTSL
jgi:hypothetical protein